MSKPSKQSSNPGELNLEDMIRAAAANGEMTHLSVVPVAGKGPNNINWSASYSPATKWGVGFGRSADPVEALKLAMTDTRLGRVVTALHKTLAKAPDNAAASKAAEALDIVDDSDFM